jgi:hypothetical protein
MGRTGRAIAPGRKIAFLSGALSAQRGLRRKQLLTPEDGDSPRDLRRYIELAQRAGKLRQEM